MLALNPGSRMFAANPVCASRGGGHITMVTCMQRCHATTRIERERESAVVTVGDSTSGPRSRGDPSSKPSTLVGEMQFP